MSIYSSLSFYTISMTILSFISGLPPLWILNKFDSSLPYLITLTSGLLLSTCINIVLPESISQLSIDNLNSSVLGPKILLGFISLYSIDVLSSILVNYFNKFNNDYNFINSIDLIESIELNNNLNSSNLLLLKNYFLSVLLNSTTLGLLIHCLTDGIILTTSLLSNNSNNSRSLIIIIAIFLHKLPTSFSLTSILINKNLKFNIILFHLFLFSISAPIAAWLTLLLSNLFNFNNNSNSFILLFSSGAFLYVSFHTFISCHKDDNDNHNSNWNYLLTMIGMLIPLFISFLHDD